MTMLDRMRRHKNWLKWSLGIVVVAFIWLYIPSFLEPQPGALAGPRAVVATVDGRDITVARFQRAYQQQMQMYRQMYGGQMDEQMLRRLGIDQRIVQQLIETEAALAEAQRRGITATDAEVRARILSLPVFQDNGQFIGADRYRQFLQSQNPPIQVSDFEEEVRRSIISEKFEGAITDWITVPQSIVDSEFTKRNEKVKLAVLSFPSDKFKDAVTVTDDEIAKEFEAGKERYRVAEKRKIKYAMVDFQGIQQRTTLTPQDIETYYKDNQQQYSTPEQARSSHILFKTEGKEDAAVKKQAEETLAKIKGGADFAALAKKLSEDPVSAAQGGDLGLGPRGKMVKEFDDAQFALKPGEVSELVKSQFGYHIIKLTEKQPAKTQTLDEVRPLIEQMLKSQRAQQEAERVSTELAGKITKPADFDTIAKQRGLVVNESGFFGRQEMIGGGLTFDPQISNRAFELKPGEVSEAVRGSQGFVFLTLTGTQESRLPTLEEVKSRVREDVQRKKAAEAARQKATSLVAQLKSGDFNAVAKAAGLEAKTTELVARGAAYPDVGANQEIDNAAFALASGGVSEPVVTETGAVVVKVLEKTSPTPDEVKNGRDTIRTELLNQEKQRFFGAYMAKAREKMNIRSNPQVLAQVVG
jgi:peptidyl-prolyl cis-trans isomerase D